MRLLQFSFNCYLVSLPENLTLYNNSITCPCYAVRRESKFSFYFYRLINVGL